MNFEFREFSQYLVLHREIEKFLLLKKIKRIRWIVGISFAVIFILLGLGYEDSLNPTWSLIGFFFLWGLGGGGVDLFKFCWVVELWKPLVLTSILHLESFITPVLGVCYWWLTVTEHACLGDRRIKGSERRKMKESVNTMLNGMMRYGHFVLNVERTSIMIFVN